MPSRTPRSQGHNEAELHTPEDLLAGAQSLLAYGDSHTRRAVVLEAMAALEAFVKSTVFGVLDQKLDPALAKWLEEKTRMNFDDRLSILVPVATGQSIDKNSALWIAYRSAREIRNKVTHNGRRVTFQEADKVLQTVRDWLAFLGSTAEVELSFRSLKKYVERVKPKIEREQDAVRVLHTFFQKTTAATSIAESVIPGGKVSDLLLQFGENLVFVEVKTASGTVDQMEEQIRNATCQVSQWLELTRRIVLVVFYRGILPSPYSAIRTLEEGKFSLVIIEA